ncbi:MAG: succinyl-diaminopimelate desuccinylase [Gammaproteobacteria bacterium]|nr:succinyl-diaminopimelate desuccinylase [Gammaproteobacteria bacterium]
MPLLDEATELLAELVKLPSITPDDAGCQALIAERLALAGFECESMRFGDVSNLWARFGAGSPLLCFAGHTDVVPPGRLDQWDSDPFVPDIRDGFLFGRGAADMKSGVTAMLIAAEQFVRQTPRFDGSLAILLTSDEEGDAIDGTIKVVDTLTARGDHIDWCVIGEPSSREKAGDVIRIGRRGSLTGNIVVHGIQGHVAYSDQVDNPIKSFAPALAELCERHWDNGDDNFPPTSLQVVNIESGLGVANVTPPQLRAQMNFRFSPAWSELTLQSEVAAILDRHSVDADIDWHLQGQPFLTPPGRLIDTTVAVIRDVADIDTRLSTGGGTSDGRFIAPTGAEVVELGPANQTIHKVNECIRLTDLGVLIRMYREIAERLLT